MGARNISQLLLGHSKFPDRNPDSGSALSKLLDQNPVAAVARSAESRTSDQKVAGSILNTG